MAKVEFKIADPKLLETGQTTQRVQMTYGDTDSPIVIDTETAFIECEALNKFAAIKDWSVDFDGHKMKLSDDTDEGNYGEIDFVTAMGMVGQLAKEVGVATLQKLICTLGSTYVDDGQFSPKSGTPTENLPSDSDQSENPSPLDEV